MSEIMKSGGGPECEKNSTSRHSFSVHSTASLTENREPSGVRLALGPRSGSKPATGRITLLIPK